MLLRRSISFGCLTGGDVAGMDKQAPDYHSYLLRLWRVNGGAASSGPVEPEWRTSLEHPLSGERVGFASLDDLVEFLRRRIGALPDTDRGEG
jgi:hypothetical protein